MGSHNTMDLFNYLRCTYVAMHIHTVLTALFFGTFIAKTEVAFLELKLYTYQLIF